MPSSGRNTWGDECKALFVVTARHVPFLDDVEKGCVRIGAVNVRRETLDDQCIVDFLPKSTHFHVGTNVSRLVEQAIEEDMVA